MPKIKNKRLESYFLNDLIKKMDIKKYINYLLTVKKFSKKYITEKEKQLQKFNQYLLYINKEISLDVIHQYIGILSNKPLGNTSRYSGERKNISTKTLSDHITAIRWYLKYIDNDIRQKIELPKKEKIKIEFLESDEIEKLLLIPDIYESRIDTKIRNKLLIMVAYYSWARLSEMLSLTFGMLSGSNQIQIIGKGGKVRSIFITKEIKDLCMEYYEIRQNPRLIADRNRVPDKILYKNDYIFISHSDTAYGKQLSVASVSEIFRKYRSILQKEYNIKKRLTCHTLRHSYATTLLKWWTDIRIIQELLWHEYINTTQRYTHVSDSMLSEHHTKIFGK